MTPWLTDRLVETVLGFTSQPLVTNHYLFGAGNDTNTLGDNLGIGVFALKSAEAVNDSTVYGQQANEFTTDGVGYCSFGRYAGQNNLIGTNTNCFGDSAGRFATGEQNSFFGYVTGEYSLGDYCSYFGNGTGQGSGGSGAHGDYMTLFGYAVQPNGLGSTRCSIFGAHGKYLGSGNDDAGIGHFVLYNSTGGENTAGGAYAGFTNVTGLRNTWFGESAGNDAVNQATNLIGSIGIGSRSYTNRNYQAVFGGTTIVETYLRGKVAINGAQSAVPRTQLDIIGNGSDVWFGASQATNLNGMRMWSSGLGVHIEAMDSTLLATYTPLNLRGSAVNVAGPASFDDFVNLPLSNRWYQNTGSQYFESNGNFWFRNYTGAYPVFLIASDGRTFPTNDVWHTSLQDGVPRLVYLANGATQFNDAQNFVGATRSHGLYSDGSIRWGSAQTGNSRGTLSWDTDKATIIVPHTLELSGAVGGVTANIFTVAGAISASSTGVAFNGTAAIAKQSIPTSPTTSEIATALSNLGLVSLT